jgi:ribonuclease D
VRAGHRVALDTEFHPEFRYHPKLMLVQLQVADEPPWLIDPKGIEDLHPLGHALSGAHLVAHAPSQDLPLLQRAAGLEPGQVTDTQVLAGFAGLGFPRRLDDLLHAVLQLPPAPGATLTDWGKRPLSPAQQAYAASDVGALIQLADALRARLSPRHEQWADAECADARDRCLRPRDPAQAWRTMGAMRVLDATSQAALKALSQWREVLAQQGNKPPGQIVPHAVLVDVARRRPTTLDQLAMNRRLPKRVLQQHGDALIRLSQVAPVADATPADRSLAAARRGLLSAWAAVHEHRTGIASRLALPEHLRDDLLTGGVLAGWRKGALKVDFSRVINGTWDLSLIPPGDT